MKMQTAIMVGILATCATIAGLLIESRLRAHYAQVSAEKERHREYCRPVVEHYRTWPQMKAQWERSGMYASVKETEWLFKQYDKICAPYLVN